MNPTIEKDKKIIWHPFTQAKTADLPIVAARGKGAYIYDENKKSYLDLISSWWVNLHGHAHPHIAHSIYEQALALEHVIFAGFTHEPAIKLCEGLSTILPSNLSRFFFSDNGSTSVEVALKMAYQYWYNQEPSKEKPLFIAFEGGYHGDTFGAMSVGSQSGFHNIFKPLLFEVLTLPYPITSQGADDEDLINKEIEVLAKFDELLEKHYSKIAAIILEPLVQGASGINMCTPRFIRNITERAQQAKILVIFDEVLTGFYRTGKCFALEHSGVVPDFLCLSKGLTGGFLPLGLTITTNKIFEAFLSEKWEHAFPHGHSYTANPLGCAAAIASLELLNDPTTKKNIDLINKTHQEGLNYLNDLNMVTQSRLLGTISAFNLKDVSFVNQTIKRKFLEEGLLLRPLKNTIYMIPPYCITAQELSSSYRKIANILTKYF